MAWTNIKISIRIAAAFLAAMGTAAVAGDYVGPPPATGKLTLKIDPEVFIRNVKACAAGTMHLPSDPWNDVWLDMLTMARVDSAPPHATEFDFQAGTIAMSNTPAALETFRRMVEELNRPDGKRNRPPTDFDSHHAILVEPYFYKMSSSDFDHLNLGPPSARGGANESGWWMLDSKAMAALRQTLNRTGCQPFQQPRIKTYPGGMAQFFAGDVPGKGVAYDVLPMRFFKAPYDKDVPEDMVELKAQVSTTEVFTSDPAGDWPVFAGRTNCAVFTRALVREGSGLLFRAVNPANSETNNLVVLSVVSVNPPSMPHL